MFSMGLSQSVAFESEIIIDERPYDAFNRLTKFRNHYLVENPRQEYHF